MIPVNYYFTGVIISFSFIITLIVYPFLDLKKAHFFPSPSHLFRNSEFRLKIAHLKPNDNVNLRCYNKRTHVSLGQFNKTFTTAVKYSILIVFFKICISSKFRFSIIRWVKVSLDLVRIGIFLFFILWFSDFYLKVCIARGFT